MKLVYNPKALTMTYDFRKCAIIQITDGINNIIRSFEVHDFSKKKITVDIHYVRIILTPII